MAAPSGCCAPSSTTPRARGNRQRRLQTELTDFRRQRARRDYAAYLRQHLPIASGVIEAACKTLVTQRLKCSGMAWSIAGGQAILTFRSLIQSDRWSRAWDLLAADFRQPITVLSPQRDPLATPSATSDAATYQELPLAV